MTEYTVDLNGKRYRLNEQFRDDIERLARAEYGENDFFDCWWGVAKEHQYDDDGWRKNNHMDGDPILTIETTGVMVPWDKLDQLDADMRPPSPQELDDDDPDEIDEGGGMKTIDPSRPDNNDIFGRSHFAITPHRFEDVPEPGGDDPESIPPKPEKIDGVEMLTWLPRHPDITHTWSAGEAISPMTSWVEWNVQLYADQPQPRRGKNNSHDRIESLCKVHDCEVIAEYTSSDDVPDGTSGTVERKGEDWFDGDVVGDRWDM